jgi:hypothetical protein
MKVNGQLQDPAASSPRERDLGTHWTGSWVGHSAGLDAVVKGKEILRCPFRELNPVT